MRRRARGYADTCRVDHGLGTQRVPLPTAATMPSLSGYFNTLMQWMTEEHIHCTWRHGLYPWTRSAPRHFGVCGITFQHQSTYL